jgi:hypothetical protein
MSTSEPSKFKQDWEAKKLLKRSKKKAKKELTNKGFDSQSASKMVKQAMKRIVGDNKPAVTKAAGRGG